MAWGEIYLLSTKGSGLHPPAKRRKSVPCLLPFLGVKEMERPDFLGAVALLLSVLLKQSYLPRVLSPFLEVFSSLQPHHMRPVLCEIGNRHLLGWHDRGGHCGFSGGPGIILVTARMSLIVHRCQPGCVWYAGQL